MPIRSLLVAPRAFSVEVLDLYTQRVRRVQVTNPRAEDCHAASVVLGLSFTRIQAVAIRRKYEGGCENDGPFLGH